MDDRKNCMLKKEPTNMRSVHLARNVHHFCAFPEVVSCGDAWTTLQCLIWTDFPLHAC